MCILEDSIAYKYSDPNWKVLVLSEFVCIQVKFVLWSKTIAADNLRKQKVNFIFILC